jgi:ribonuclease E
VQQYRDPEIPLFHRYQIESQLDAMHNPVVTLKSGGYIVINPTEALVAIDVNSGRATRERNIEETAYKTNAEAADEIARQLRLRDLAGLIVIDFIDMEESRNQHNVEKRLKDAMRVDRARIQIGKISAFGLLELSRQRLRPSFLEASTERCPHCEGTGLVRSTESAALHVIRAVEEEGIRRRAAEIRLVVPTTVALYILNHKRTALVTLEQRYGFNIVIDTDDTLIPPNFRLERLKAQTAPPPSLSVQAGPPQPEEESRGDLDIEDDAAVEDEEERDEQPVAAEEHGEPAEIEARDDEARPAAEPHDERRGRRSRRRRGGEDRDRGRNRHERPGQDRPERHDRPAAATVEAATGPDQTQEGIVVEGAGEAASGEPRPIETHAGEASQGDDAARKRRRRGKRGGRRRRRHEDGTVDTGRMNANGEPQGFQGEAHGANQGYESNIAGTQPDWQSPDDGAPQPPPRHEPEHHREPDHHHEPAARHEPPQHERPAAAEHRGNGETYGASTPAPRESTQRLPEPPAPAAPSQPENDGPKRKGWWQRLTQ